MVGWDRANAPSPFGGNVEPPTLLFPRQTVLYFRWLKRVLQRCGPFGKVAFCIRFRSFAGIVREGKHRFAKRRVWRWHPVRLFVFEAEMTGDRRESGSGHRPDDITLEIGGSRYIQRPDAVRCLGAEVARLGSKCLIVTGRESFSTTWKAVMNSLRDEGIVWSVQLRPEGGPTRAEALNIARTALGKGCDVIVGIGGGSALDLAKAVADDGQLPLVHMPTSSATFAASTSRANMFDFSGAPDGSLVCERPAQAIIVDETLLSRQPSRFVAAGALAAMAQVDAASRVQSGSKKDEGPERQLRPKARKSAPLDSGFLETFGVPAYREVAQGQGSAVLSKVLFTSIAVPGLAEGDVPDTVREGLPQRFHDGFLLLFPEQSQKWLYGEIVAVGLLLLQACLGDSREAGRLKAAMREMKMPTSIRRLGVSPEDSRMESFRDYLCSGMPSPSDAKAKRRLLRALESIT